ncbi:MULTISPECIES: hypothetical protein [unclassified Streptomyces]|uniref:hypothetical protein n=1 Tax=unclassified Streptomyces TaxID=2593676 RepID=UPI000DC7C526|nr:MULTISPECIES: hypothetical protein [unclassified Streptomyces]AWZ04610.1 hypothetical protein DRB89_08125 [Streptomyces sp. ICC4]AWZ16365.1 hypothetical protein DRB96_33710 [Streptomyces sp. ICC1]
MGMTNSPGPRAVTIAVRHAREGGPLSKRAWALREAFGVESAEETVSLAPVSVSLDGITLVTGFSGTGKSSVLRELSRLAKVRTVADLPPHGPTDRVIDLFDGEVGATVSWLGRFGLGEPRLMMSRPEHLSDGQRHRLTLARLARTGGGDGSEGGGGEGGDGFDLIVVDEFCSNLDRTTAKVIAHNFQRVCRSLRLNAVVATAHDDLHEFLSPDEHLRLDFDGTARKTVGAYVPGRRIERWIGEEFAESAGDRADYEQLADYHYRVEDERWIDWENLVTEVRTIRVGGTLAAVKVFCRPFPREFEALETLRRINGSVLLQERVIVHPAFRGLSLNARMWPESGSESGSGSSGVPPAEPERKTVFAQSALGRLFPFHLRAGYRAVEHPSETPAREQIDLAAALRRHDPGINANSTRAIAALLTALPEEGLSEIRELASAAFVIATRRQIVFLAELAGLEAREADLDFVGRASLEAARTADPASLAVLVETATPFRMAGFIRHWSPEHGWRVTTNGTHDDEATPADPATAPVAAAGR